MTTTAGPTVTPGRVRFGAPEPRPPAPVRLVPEVRFLLRRMRRFSLIPRADESDDEVTAGRSETPGSGESYNEKTGGLPEEAAALLWTLGLSVDKKVRVLVCRTCWQGVCPHPSTIINHVQGHAPRGHRILSKRPTLFSELRKILEELQLAEAARVRFQPPDRAPIPGIEVHTGYYCPVVLEDGTKCRRAYRKTDSLYQHLKDTHRTAAVRPKKADLSHYDCNCQTIFLGNLIRYFKVITGLSGLEQAVNPYSVFVQSASDEIPSSSTVLEGELKTRELPSLLRITKWHLFVNGYREDPKDIVHLISHPASSASTPREQDCEVEQVLAKLPDIADAWMAKIAVYHQLSTHTMLRILHGMPM